MILILKTGHNQNHQKLVFRNLMKLSQMVKIDNLFYVQEMSSGMGTITSLILKGLAALELPPPKKRGVRMGSEIDFFFFLRQNDQYKG